MVAKAILIVAVFVSFAREQAALIFTIVAPLVVLVSLISVLNFVAAYTFAARARFFGVKQRTPKPRLPRPARGSKTAP
jgi:cytochrome c oxidase subunit IV